MEKKQYQLYTDACDISIGAVLEQADEDENLRPITFELRKLNKHEINYMVLVLQAFKFEVYYKSRKRYGNADGISRYPRDCENGKEDDEEFVNVMLMRVDMLNKQMKRYCIIGENLYKRGKGGVPPKYVIFDDEEKYTILIANHRGIAEEEGHHGINGTARKILMNYSWVSGNVYEDAKKYMKSCIQYQRCATKSVREPIHVTAMSWIFYKLYINCLGPLPRTSGGHEHMVIAVEELFRYVEGKALRKKNANMIAQFIWDEIITRYGCFTILVSDRGTEFKNNILAELAIRLNINQRFVASYHPEANGHAECTVQKFTRIIRKICAEKQNK
ncbi:592_t:CDS:2 [Scutellospora calospora]|uniref:592_t:CDS:1 n=1 Tax=Scutellospora calospora TaxID=85575 RepID=A0ACA9JY46_9GLOM|nr:592_t:CDS:2 [Scutellospora calospora]